MHNSSPLRRRWGHHQTIAISCARQKHKAHSIWTAVNLLANLAVQSSLSSSRDVVKKKVLHYSFTHNYSFCLLLPLILSEDPLMLLYI